MSVLTEPTDTDAMAASLGDADRFAVIFDRHFLAIHRFLHRRVGRDAADELAGETFAQALRIPIGTVRSRLHRARRRIRELLEASGQSVVETHDEGERDG